MGPSNPTHPLLAGTQLKCETPLLNVNHVLWRDEQLFCSCDEVNEHGKPAEPPRLVAISRNGEIGAQCTLTDTVRCMVDCGVRGIFIALTELEILVVDHELHIQSRQSHSGPATAAWNWQLKSLFTCTERFIVSWRFRFGQFTLMKNHRIKSNAGLDVFQLVASHDGEVAQLTPSAVFATQIADDHCNVHDDLHVTAMTQLAWCTNGWVTGAEDGTIKVWRRLNWQLLISFISHGSPIVGIQCASVDLISSLDADGILLTWSLKSGEVTAENRHLTRSAKSLNKGFAFTDKNEHLATFDCTGVGEWENNFVVNKLVEVESITEGITSLTLGMPYIPHEQSENRLACVIDRHRVLLMTNHGRIIATLDMDNPITSVAYQRVLECLVVVAGGSWYTYGVADCELAQSPEPKLLSTIATGDWATCAAFSLEVEDETVEHDWAQFNVDQVRKNRAKLKLHNAILFIGAKTSGIIASVDINKGAILHSILPPDEDGNFTALAVGHAHSRMITATDTGVCYVWRLFSNSLECFDLEHKIMAPHPTEQVIVTRASVAVAVNSPSQSQYAVHKLVPHQRHEVEDDHRNRITSIDACESLRFFITASHDGSIKVWDEWNQLIITIELGQPIAQAKITTQGGDIAVSFVGSAELYFIKYQDYLPERYISKHVIESIGRGEKPLYKENEKRRTNDKLDAKMTDLTESDCDRDIMRIKNGDLNIQKRDLTRHEKELTYEEAFEEYIKMFHTSQEIILPHWSDDEDDIGGGDVPSNAISRNSDLRKTPESSGRRSKSWSKYATDPLDDVTSTMMARNELNEEIDSKSSTLLNLKPLATPPPPVEEPKPMSLMDRMAAAINEEAKKEEEVKKMEEAKVKQEQVRSEQVAKTRQSEVQLVQTEAKLKIDKEKKMKVEASRMTKMREEAKAKKAARPKTPPKPATPPPKEPTPEPEPVKPPTPKPPTPPPSPEWESLGSYAHHSWFTPFRDYCDEHTIKVRTFNDFLPSLIEFFNLTSDIIVKHALVAAFDELYHNGVFEGPHLIKRLLLGLQQLLSGDMASAKHPIRLATIHLAKDIDHGQSWFGVELLVWMAQNGDNDLLAQFDIEDREGFVSAEMVKWDGQVRRHARRFIEQWTKRHMKKTKSTTTSWQCAIKLFVETERDRRNNAAKEVHNTVMEMTKRAGGALVRIGDLHTARRFNDMVKLPVLPPLELRVKNKGNPKVIRLAVNNNKILLAPLGKFWGHDSSRKVLPPSTTTNKLRDDLITSRFQKFYCPNNSYQSYFDN